MNVLFIAVDDLRPELNTYGASHIQSPNIDRLAASGIQFDSAYANVPVCGASRASLLTGIRPTRDRFLTYYTWAEKDAPSAVTLPEHFRNHGYYTVGRGKIFHHQVDSEDSWDENWRPPANGPTWRDYYLPENQKMDTTGSKRGPAFESALVPDSAYSDGKMANKVIDDLRKLKDRDEPFFLAAGFLKPHLPFNVPQKYWDMYDPEQIEFPATQFGNSGAPEQAYHNFGELRNYGNIPPDARLPDSLARKLIHGYYAAVSYADAQVGRLLDELDRLGLRENTIIVLWGDHGWNLREHGLWCKHCNFETSLHSPLILDIPGEAEGLQIDEVVEFVDIYPGLVEAAGLPHLPQLQGESFVPLIKGNESGWDNVAVSKWHSGLTLIKDQYFYTEWSDSTEAIHARMLFDHEKDPDETNNLADDPAYEDIVQELSKQLKAERGF
ncbi:MAG: sulfatase [Balneolaceae bacterium]|nr:sulfatase [Balneolaceae bacterium]